MLEEGLTPMEVRRRLIRQAAETSRPWASSVHRGPRAMKAVAGSPGTKGPAHRGRPGRGHLDRPALAVLLLVVPRPQRFDDDLRPHVADNPERPLKQRLRHARLQLALTVERPRNRILHLDLHLERQ